MASTQSYLNLIMQYESYGGQNVPNYRFSPGYTAQGYYQITNDNWLKIAPILGIDTSLYPNAMSAPQDVQTQVANYLLTQTPAGISNWANYNPQLAGALAAAGMQTSGPIVNGVAGGGALVDVSGTAATMPTSDIMSQLNTAAAGAGIDLTSPATMIAVALGVGLAAYLVLS